MRTRGVRLVSTQEEREELTPALLDELHQQFAILEVRLQQVDAKLDSILELLGNKD
jgi:uncharacterized membrane protein